MLCSCYILITPFVALRIFVLYHVSVILKTEFPNLNQCLTDGINSDCSMLQPSELGHREAEGRTNELDHITCYFLFCKKFLTTSVFNYVHKERGRILYFQPCSY
jgi:hypothetical protein